MWIKTIGTVLACLASATCAAAYFFIADGVLPEQSDFLIEPETLFELADAPAIDRPSKIEFEIVARSNVPKFGTHAGLDRSPVVMARAVFRLRSTWGDTLIDVGMDEAVARRFNPADTFYPEAAMRVQSALATAKRIAVTHEHPDHIGLLGRIELTDQIRRALRLNATQIESVAQYTDDNHVPEELAILAPIPLEEISEISPGVIMIPAPGHTPGSVMFFVRMQDETQILFLGDIVWNMSNIEDERGRPRFVQRYVMPMPEDRLAVYSQVAALVELNKSSTDIVLIPSHDEKHLRQLIEAGVLSETFQAVGDAANP